MNTAVSPKPCTIEKTGKGKRYSSWRGKPGKTVDFNLSFSQQ
jgi:hypothetical protein